MLFGCLLSSSSSSSGGSSGERDSNKDDAGKVFSVVFATIAFGAVALTLNVKFLGGRIVFLQAMSLIGYCIFPLDVAAALCLLSENGWFRLVVVTAGVVWSASASVPFVSSAVTEERRALAVYPTVLLFVTLGVFVVAKV